MKKIIKYIGKTIICIFAIIGLLSTIMIMKSIISFKFTPEKSVNNVVSNDKDTIEKEFAEKLPSISANLKFINDIVANDFLFDVDMKNIENSIYKGYIDGLNDIYTVYYTPKEFKELMEDTNGKYCGIGATVIKNKETNLIKILNVFDGSPSKEAGLQADDILYKVNGIDITDMDLDLLVKEYIRGEENTKLTITVLRGEEKKPIDLTITRKLIEVPTVKYKMLDNKIAYVQVSQFDTITDEQFKKAVDSAINDGAKALTIDLRNNPGGDLDTVINMLDFVLPDGLVMYTKDKYGNGEKYYSDDGQQLNLPIDVLINENSASASEVFTGAFKDFHYGTIIGTKSFGKGIVQEVLPFKNGGGLKITTHHYYTPSGFDLHKKGIEPDIKIDMKIVDINTDKDIQLKTAIDDLKKKIK